MPDGVRRGVCRLRQRTASGVCVFGHQPVRLAGACRGRHGRERRRRKRRRTRFARRRVARGQDASRGGAHRRRGVRRVRLFERGQQRRRRDGRRRGRQRRVRRFAFGRVAAGVHRRCRRRFVRRDLQQRGFVHAQPHARILQGEVPKQRRRTGDDPGKAGHRAQRDPKGRFDLFRVGGGA